jgi:arginyl-tRNA synthetase
MRLNRGALAIVQEKNPVINGYRKSGISEKVALGALKYSMLSRDNAKYITFDWEAALDFKRSGCHVYPICRVRKQYLKKIRKPIAGSKQFCLTN